MKLRFENYSKKIGSRGNYNWFEWQIFVDEPADKLERIDRVEYRLHETFPNPVRVVSDATSKFALRAEGWGEFWVFITIYMKDGTEKHDKYYLKLGRTWPGGIT